MLFGHKYPEMNIAVEQHLLRHTSSIPETLAWRKPSIKKWSLVLESQMSGMFPLSD